MRGARVGRTKGVALKENGALIRPNRASQNLDESALPGAVLTDQGMNLAGRSVKLGARKGGDTAEALRHRGGLQKVHDPSQKKRRPTARRPAKAPRPNPAVTKNRLLLRR